ncbi:hypothetical protein MKK70_11115 [Methylobacterium sp. E-041]|uniref:hypothetical protein n=1 Tax=Methylobacterium sp. E-041 TaxID=2836573 RepID=UPI001FBA2A39|nr:hypothetical protein [Methylobacterium sp. E-041]MCJ2105915.1 hypothetical protein [Methylobacterium sp. E-041]
MKSAVYYPHTQLKQPGVLKSALLLWDKLEFIVPYKDFELEHPDKDVQDGLEVIGSAYCPSEEDKSNAHAMIEDFATGPLPESFLYHGDRVNDFYRYGMFPEKLLPETWGMLRELRLVGRDSYNGHVPLEDSAGLALMSILADCCAGKTKTRITDRGIAYAALTNLMTNQGQAGCDQYELIVPITFSVIKTSDIPLKNLVAFRRREAAKGGHAIRDLRHRYLDCLNKQIGSLKDVAKHSDRIEINRQFEVEMTDDLKFLRDELRSSKKEVFFSKEIVMSAVAATASFIAASKGVPLDIPGVWNAAGSAITIGGILSTQNKFASSRAAIMKKHPMAYLYELERNRY